MYYITVSNGLLSAEHKKRMGSAVWEFMWCLDKITKIDSHNIGWVLGGKAIKLEDVGMGHANTTSRNLKKLEKGGYLKIYRTPYGISIRVMNAKKRFTKNSESLKRVNHQKLESPTKNGESPTKNGDSLTRNGESNIRQYQYDKSVDISTDNTHKGPASYEARKGPQTIQENLKRFNLK